MQSLKDALAARQAAEAEIFEHFNLSVTSLGYPIEDLTDEEWSIHTAPNTPPGPPSWCRSEDSSDRFFCYQAEDIYGTSYWETKEYTLCVVWDNGEKRCLLFDNSKKIDPDFLEEL